MIALQLMEVILLLVVEEMSISLVLLVLLSWYSSGHFWSFCI